MIFLFKRKKRKLGQKGQAIVEYILVMAVIITLLIVAMQYLRNSEYFFKNLTSPMVAYMRYSYKYGDQKAQGWDETNPTRHIIMNNGDTDEGGSPKNFKFFIPKDI